MESKATKNSSMWCKVKDLHPTKMKPYAAIKVRLVRMYKAPAPGSKNEFLSIECVFHDSEGERIHISIPKMFIAKWDSPLKEGQLYGIKNFMVINNIGKYKITTHTYKVKFNADTVLKKCIESDFPRRIFVFKAFKEIEILDPIIDGELYDVIGLLLNKPTIQCVTCQNGAQKNMTELVLQNTEGHRLTCTLWGDYASDALKLLEKNGQPSNIIILQLGRPHHYWGKMIMQTNYHVSKIIVNADIPEIKEFRLPFHLPGEQNVIFSDLDPIDVVIDQPTVKQSKFLAWMDANKKYPEARELTYAEFPTKFVWKANIRAWEPRQAKCAIGRLLYVPPGSGELYYLRCLLNIVHGPTSYEDIRCINGVQYATFRDACYALGLIEDDKEYIDGIIEASHWASAKSLRSLFVTLLFSNSLTRPDDVWDNCWTYLCDDILYNQRIYMGNPDLTLEDFEGKSYGLVEVEKLLRNLGKSLSDFEYMSFPEERYFQTTIGNSLINEELRYSRDSQHKEYQDFLKKCTDEQRCVHDTVLKAVDSNKGGIFFVYGYGGTGKTFVWKGLSAALRLKGEIVINVASSGIASLLLPGGRTAHSRFKIPINPNEDSTCNISQGSPLAELIIKAKLIIWDEAPMMHKFCFEALDRSCRDIMRFSNPENFDSPFGGKTVVLGGDFRQILPVIPNGSRQDIVHATINSSYLWNYCTVLRLTKNMRIQNAVEFDEFEQSKDFGQWIASIGDGTIGGPNDGEAVIEIPNDILLKYSTDPIAAIVDHIYDLKGGANNNGLYLQDRAVLAPTLAVVDTINQYMVSLNEEEGRSFFSSDSTCTSDSNGSILSDIHTPEFLNTLKCSGVPNHDLYLEVGTPVMLLRNIDHANGLCNGTRLVITKLGNRVLEAEVLTGHNAGNKILIPRLSLTPSDPRLPFKFQRRQFPLIISYAMTINKSQGQSLKRVGLFLKNHVFSHGQLYVAVSRATCRSGLKILVCRSKDDDEISTQNVVFKEIFQNL